MLMPNGVEVEFIKIIISVVYSEAGLEASVGLAGLSLTNVMQVHAHT